MRMVAPGHLVVETNGKQFDVRQEEEYEDESMQVGLSFIDPEGAGNACSLCRGSSTPCSERLDHEGALMVKFKGKCAAALGNTSRSRNCQVPPSFARSVVGLAHVVVGVSD